MSKEPNNIDRLVREKLEGFEMTPPADVWASTASTLNAGKKKRFFLWFALSLALLSILGAGIYYLSSSEKTEEQLLTENNLERTGKAKNEEKQPSDKLKNQNDASSKVNGDNGQNTTTDAHLISREIDGSTSHTTGNTTSIDVVNDSGFLNKSNNSADNADINNSITYSQEMSASNRSASNANNKQSAENELSENYSMISSTTSTSKNSAANSDEKATKLTSTSKIDQYDLSKDNSNDKTRRVVEYGSLKTHAPQLFIQTFQSPIVHLFGSDTLPTKAPFWKSISIEGAVGISTFRNVPKKSTNTNLASTVNQAAMDQFGLDLRFGANYHFNDRLSFQTGIHYNSSKEKYTYNDTETSTFSYTDSIMTTDSLTWDTTYILFEVMYDSSYIVSKTEPNTYKIFALPFQFAWTQSISTRSSLEFSLGGEISIFGKNTGTISNDNSNLILAENAYHTSGMLSLGGSVKYLYKFGNHHAVYAEPWAQFGITNQSTPALNYESLRRTYGIRVGYRFYF